MVTYARFLHGEVKMILVDPRDSSELMLTYVRQMDYIQKVDENRHLKQELEIVQAKLGRARTRIDALKMVKCESE